MKNQSSLYPSLNTDIPYHMDTTKIHYRNMIQEFQASPLKTGEIVILGDSITQHWSDWPQFLPRKDIRNRGISGDVTDGVLIRLQELIYFKPKAVFLLIGINDLYNHYYQKAIPSPLYVTENILKTVHRLKTGSPDTQVFVQTILPTLEPYLRSAIDFVNDRLRKEIGKREYLLIDLFTAFADEESYIKGKYTTDGTHLSGEGYRLWGETLFPFLNVL